MITNISEPIITDPTDQDVYKFSMQNFLFCQNLLHEKVEFRFFNRGKTKFPIGFGDALRKQVDMFSDLRFKDYMLEHMLISMPWLNQEYVECYLKTFRFKPETVYIKQDGQDLDLRCFGDYGDIIHWETQLMATMSELYNFMTDMDTNAISMDERIIHNTEKFEAFNKINEISNNRLRIADYSMRRRYSKLNQKKMLSQFLDIAPNVLAGTSNLMFSRELNLKPIGTYAHELTMYFAAIYGPLMANRITMDKWMEVYKGALGTALPDTYTTKLFLNDFDLLHAKLYDGVREDSAPDPIAYQNMIIDFYKSLNIDPTTKTIMHSNGIDSLELVEKLTLHRIDNIRRAFGIGTWLANDVYKSNDIFKPVNWVIKMTSVHTKNYGIKHTVKLSDVPGKVTSIHQPTVDLYKQLLNVE